MTSPVRILVATAVVVLALLTGCSQSNLQFSKDDRLHFMTPKSRQLVSSPVTLSWTMSDFQVEKAGATPPSAHAGYFALFVDRAPIKPGQTLQSLADKSCRQTPGCFNAQYLAVRNVYATSGFSFTISQIQLNTHEKVQLHEVTIVLLNTAGERIGESSWYVDFRVRSRGV